MIDSNFLRRYTNPSKGHFTYDDNPLAYMRHPKSNPSKEEMYKSMESDDWSLRQATVVHKNADDIVLRSGFDDMSIDVRNNAIKHPNLPNDLLDKAVNSSNSTQNLYASMNPNATTKHLDQLAHSDNERVLRTVAENPKLSPEKHEMLLKDPSEHVQIAAMHNPNTTDDQIDNMYTTTRSMHVQDEALRIKYAKMDGVI